MKLNLRSAVWALALTFTLAVLVAPTIVAAQSEQGLEHGRGHNKDNDNANNSNYQQGWNHGQDDRANNRARRYRMRPYNDADRRAYESGYDQGYQGNSAYRGQPGYRQYGNQNFQGVAYNNGRQEGMRYGQADRSRGKSNQPTGSGVYQNADRGYNSSYGDKSAYRNAFRQGYKAGYAEGYSSGQAQSYRR